MPVFDTAGDPIHERGTVSGAPGLYFVGLQFLYSMTSATVNGVGRDAERVVRAIELRIANEKAKVRGASSKVQPVNGYDPPLLSETNQVERGS
jgi:hypothetical protein